MEVPIGTNRWDKPLFVVKPEDKTPIEAISQAVLSGKQLTAQHLPSLPVCVHHLHQDANVFLDEIIRH